MSFRVRRSGILTVGILAALSGALGVVLVDAVSANESLACTSQGRTLGEARQAYSDQCTQPRVDCDPIGGIWICSSKQLGDSAPSRSNPVEPKPTTTVAPAPGDDELPFDPDEIDSPVEHVVTPEDFPPVEPPADLPLPSVEEVISGESDLEVEIEGGELVEAGQDKIRLGYARASWQHFKKLFPESIWGRFNTFFLNPAFDTSSTFPEGYETGDYLLRSTFATGGLSDFIRIHEVGHLLTLDKSDIDYSQPPVVRPTGVTAKCPTGDTYGGCARPGTLLARWAQEFWPKEFSQEALPNIAPKAQLDFFEKYSDDFWSSYATTNSSEDFAESFATFVYWDHPTLEDGVADEDATIKERKIAWFFADPEMVEIRDYIISNLEPAAERPPL